MEVGDLPDGGHGVAVLGQAHRPAGDQPLFALGQQQREFLDRIAADPGQLFNLHPRRRFEQTTIFLVAAAVLADEAGVRRTHRHQRLRHPAEQRHVAVDLHLQVARCERRGFPEDPAQVLRMGEAEQAGFLQRIHRDHPRPTGDRFLKGRQHPRMIRPGILADAEDDIRFQEIVQRHGALAHPDGFLQGQAARLVTHVRAVRQVVGAESAHEHLPQEGGLVARAAGSVEERLVRGIQFTQFIRHDRERFVPGDRFVMRRALAQQQRLGEAALEIVPGIAFGHQLGDGMRGEEIAADGPAHRLRGDRLCAVLTELGDRAWSVGVRPGAARAVEATGLVDAEQRLRPADHPGLAEDVLQRRDHRGSSGSLHFRGGESGFAHSGNLTGVAVAARLSWAAEGETAFERPSLSRKPRGFGLLSLFSNPGFGISGLMSAIRT